MYVIQSGSKNPESSRATKSASLSAAFSVSARESSSRASRTSRSSTLSPRSPNICSRMSSVSMPESQDSGFSDSGESLKIFSDDTTVRFVQTHSLSQRGMNICYSNKKYICTSQILNTHIYLTPVLQLHNIHLEFSTCIHKLKWILCTENPGLKQVLRISHI